MKEHAIFHRNEMYSSYHCGSFAVESVYVNV